MDLVLDGVEVASTQLCYELRDTELGPDSGNVARN